MRGEGPVGADEKPRKAKAEKLAKGIRKVESGRYQVRYTGPDGRRYSGGTFTRKLDAERALARLTVKTETEVDKGSWKPPRKASDPGPNPKTLTLRQLSEEWISSRVDRQGRPLAPKTVELYRRLVDSPLREFGDQPIQQIHSEAVQAWWNRGEFGTARTRNGAYKYLKSLLDWAQERELITASPCKVRNGTLYTPKPTLTPTDTEVAIILETAEGDDLKAVLALTAYCALRPQEVLGLRRKDVGSVERGDETRWVVAVVRALSWLKGGEVVVKPPKSREGSRSLVVPSPAVPYILKHLSSVSSDPEAFIFSRDPAGRIPWAQTRLNQRFKKPKAIAGYAGSPYSFRHYHLTRYAMTGASTREIMERGGHASWSAAMRYQRSVGRDFELVEKL
jgi:integrase